MVAISFGVVAGWDTGFPPWAFVVCLLLPIIWLIPIGIVQAITNIQLGLNVLPSSSLVTWCRVGPLP